MSRNIRKGIWTLGILLLLSLPSFAIPSAEAFNSGLGKISTYKWWNMSWEMGTGAGWDGVEVGSGAAFWTGTEYWLYYTGVNATNITASGLATSPDHMTWTRYASNPILTVGTSSAWDNRSAAVSSVLKDGATYRMWYVGSNGAVSKIGYATSADGKSWTKSGSNPVLSPGAANSWDGTNVTSAKVILEGGTFRMWYSGVNGSVWSIGYATSANGVTWTKSGANPVLKCNDSSTWEKTDVGYPCVLNYSGELQMWYCGREGPNWTIGYANSTDGTTWSKYSYNPVLTRAEGSMTENGILQPAVLYNGSAFLMWFTAIRGSTVIVGTVEGRNACPARPDLSRPWDCMWGTERKPQFKWTFNDDDARDKQTAFQIQVAWDKNFTDMCFDTGKNYSTDNTFTPSQDLPEGYLYWHMRTWDTEDDVSYWSTTWLHPLDASPPTNPSYVNCTTHKIGVWSTQYKMSFEFSGASDNLSGLQGYSIDLNNKSDTNSTGRDLLSTAVGYTGFGPNGNDVYFHIRALDTVWFYACTTYHLGPFWIDGVPPSPQPLCSETHTEGTDVWSNKSVVKLNWTPATDPYSGVKGYAIGWSDRYSFPLHEVIDLDANTTNFTTQPLPDGVYYFSYTPCDVAGNWQKSQFVFGPVQIDTSIPENPDALYSTSHATGVYSSDSTIDVCWGSAFDPMSGIGGYSYAWDNNLNTLPDSVAEVDGSSAWTSSPPLASGTNYYFHIRTKDKASNWNASAVHLGPFWIDADIPQDSVQLWSPSHTTGLWSRDNSVDVNWSLIDQGDPLSGCAGHSFVWDTSPTTLPDTTMEIGGDVFSTTSPNLVDGSTWYFHIRTRDKAGNWGTKAAHLGPFCIDTTAPVNPTQFPAMSHVQEEWSTDSTISASWSGASDPLSGIGGFSYLWDTLPYSIPDAKVMAKAGENSTTSPTLSDGKNWYFHIRTVDAVGNWAVSAAHLGPFMIDATPPDLLLVELNGKASVSNSTNVTASLAARDLLPGSGVSEMRFSLNNQSWQPWVPYLPYKRIDFTDKDGPNSLYVEVRDGAGNIGRALKADIFIDTKPPTISSVLINDGANFTRNSRVTTSILATDVGGTGLFEISFSLDGNAWGPWEPFVDNKIIDLSPGDGVKGAFFRVRDYAGWISSPVSDEIVVDTTAPVSLSLKFAQGINRTSSRTVQLQLAAADPMPSSGLHEMSFSEDGVAWSTWEPFSAITSYTFAPGDGPRSIYFRVSDRACNFAVPIRGTIFLDTQPPLLVKTSVLSVGQNGAIICVTLDEPATISLHYGQKSTSEKNLTVSTESRAQEIILTGLESGKTYRFKVTATDSSGNGPGEGPELIFRTEGTPAPVKPAGTSSNQQISLPVLLTSVILMIVIIASGAVISRKMGKGAGP